MPWSFKVANVRLLSKAVSTEGAAACTGGAVSDEMLTGERLGCVCDVAAINAACHFALEGSLSNENTAFHPSSVVN